jgi:hypothetical protein
MHVCRIMPLSVKLGGLSFQCTCRDSHRTLVCEDAVAVNMLFDSELKVPDDERTCQIKAREKAKLTNPFNADSEKERKKREKEKKVGLEKPVWKPSIERVDADVQDSVASMVAKTSRRKLQVNPKP